MSFWMTGFTVQTLSKVSNSEDHLVKGAALGSILLVINGQSYKLMFKLKYHVSSKHLVTLMRRCTQV